MGSFPSSYLGLSLGGNLRFVSFWNPTCDKICKRLEVWKKGFFLKAGRLTLIKSVLSGILVYYLLWFKSPSLVCKSIEKYMRDFPWEGVGEGHGSHLVNWELVGQLMSKGGLGIGNLIIRNISLLAKWLWCFYLESDSLWHRIIVSKHGPHPFEWTSLGVKGTF